jgi:hypothetical protein
MAQGQVETYIRRTPDDIFAVIADVSKNHRWSSSAIEGRQTTPGPVDVGTTAHEVSMFLGRRIEVDSVLTQFVPGRLLAYRTTGGPFPFAGSFEVREEGRGSRITAAFEATPAGLFRIVAPLFPGLVRRKFARDLANLKALMEAGRL